MRFLKINKPSKPIPWTFACLSLVLLAAVFAQDRGDSGPECLPTRDNAVGCIVGIKGEAWFQHGSTGPAQKLKFDSPDEQKEIKNGDGLWLDPGNSAFVYFYFPRQAAKDTPKPRKPQVEELDYVAAPKGSHWNRGSTEYTADDMRYLRRKLHLAGIGKSLVAASEEIQKSGGGDRIRDIADVNGAREVKATGSPNRRPTMHLQLPVPGDVIESLHIPFAIRCQSSNPVTGFGVVLSNTQGVVKAVQMSDEQLSAFKNSRGEYRLVLIDVSDWNLSGEPYNCEVTVSYSEGRIKEAVKLRPSARPIPSLDQFIKLLSSQGASSPQNWDVLTEALQTSIDESSHTDVFSALAVAFGKSGPADLSGITLDSQAGLCLSDFGKELGFRPDDFWALLKQPPIILR